MVTDNLHAGHRERLINKVLASENGLAEHEILEALLFPVFARKDTNALAHKLIKYFGSITEVLSAPTSMLLLVDGVGKNTAAYISLLGKAFKLVREKKSCEKETYISFEKLKDSLRENFIGLSKEKLTVYMLDKKFRLLCNWDFDGGGDDFILCNTDELAQLIALRKPHFIVLAHNHPSGLAYPSEANDKATAKVCSIGEALGVKVADHIIYSEVDSYSYFYNNRLDYARKLDLEEKNRKLESATEHFGVY